MIINNIKIKTYDQEVWDDGPLPPDMIECEDGDWVFVDDVVNIVNKLLKEIEELKK